MILKNAARGAGLLLLALGLTLAGLQCPLGRPDLGKVPGVVVDHRPAPSWPEVLLGRAEYVGSPSIAILPGGIYAASHDLFGRGSTQDTSGETRIFRSTDRGASWTHAATLNGQFWSTVFAHKGVLYIFGYTRKGGDIIIRRSTDAGSTWTSPVDENSGLLKAGRFGGTPNRPVVHEGRLWIAQSSHLMSAPEDADLLKASSWTPSKSVPQDKSWLGGRFNFWSEGQVSASPEQGVVVLPKVNQLPYTAILRAESPRLLTFDPYSDFVELPGAEKKFGVGYDAVSGKFHVCSNVVLPVHQDDWRWSEKPALIRNAAVLLASQDLHNWDVQKIILYSPDVHREAFQYLNFLYDDDDLAIISRTAFVVGGHKPPRGHDSNLMTFHRLEDFRHATPDHVLEIDARQGRVLRLERTQYEKAPLGTFTLGAEFEGKPLQDPAGLAQDREGFVYIREASGRVLQFDAAGNFLGLADGAPVTFEEHTLSVSQPPAGERTWTGTLSTDWAEPTNWYYWGRPDTPGELAIFGSAANADTEITLDRVLRVKGLRFHNAAAYTIAGSGEVFIGATDSEGVLEALEGQHTVQTSIRLANAAHAHIEAGAGITCEGPFALSGETLILDGPGRLMIRGAFSMAQGRLVVSTEAPLVFDNTATATFDGTLEVRLAEGATPNAGDRFDVLEFSRPFDGAFDEVKLPELPPELTWDAAALYTTGEVAVTQKSAQVY